MWEKQLPLAAAGYVAPWAAAIGMSASSLLVMLNALRLTRGAKRSGWMAALLVDILIQMYIVYSQHWQAIT